MKRVKEYEVKRRTKRDLFIFGGVIAILVVVALLNSQLKRRGLAEEMEALRSGLEAKRIDGGLQLLSWKFIKKTRGSLRSGGTYDETLLAYDGQSVNLMGFQVPQEQFRNVDEFLLLPIPIECYFCAMPPSRDVMLVKMAEGLTTDIYSEPVLLNGTLRIHKGPEVKFFYSIENAKIGPGEMGGELVRRRLELQHMLPVHDKDPELMLAPVPREQSDTD